MDALNWMLNSRVERVMASGGNNVFKQRETIDNAAIVVEYGSGVRLSFDFCLFPTGRRTVIIGSEGTIQPETGKVAIRQRSGAGVRYVDLV